MSYATILIKPDAHRDVLAEMIVRDIENGGLKVIFRKDLVLSAEDAEVIYSDEADKKIYAAAKESLLGTERNPFVTIIVVKSDGDENALAKVLELKGKTNIGGIRKRYLVKTKEHLEGAGLNDQEILKEFAKNRIHVPDDGDRSIELLRLILRDREIDELRQREPELAAEIIKNKELDQQIIVR